MNPTRNLKEAILERPSTPGKVRREETANAVGSGNSLSSLWPAVVNKCVSWVWQDRESTLGATGGDWRLTGQH